MLMIFIDYEFLFKQLTDYTVLFQDVMHSMNNSYACEDSRNQFIAQIQRERERERCFKR